MRSLLLLIVSLMAVSTAAQSDTLFCANPFADYSGLASSELRQLSEQCDHPALSLLYLNRAYHKDLLTRFKTLSQIQSSRGEKVTRHYHSQRILVGMAEALAYESWRQGKRDVLGVLNRSYDQAIEVAEYQLRGNDLYARRAAPKPTLR